MPAKRRRKAKNAKGITLPGGMVAPQPKTQGSRPKPEDAMATVTAARKRHTGLEDGKDALQPIHGTDLGKCIHSLTTGDDRANLTNAWAAISASHRNYRLLVIGQTGDPQGSAMPMTPDPMETDQSLRVDLRTADERIAAAKSSWAAWEAKINTLPTPNLKWALRGALNGFLGEGTLWANQAPTMTGRAAVSALRGVM